MMPWFWTIRREVVRPTEMRKSRGWGVGPGNHGGRSKISLAVRMNNNSDKMSIIKANSY